MRNIAFVDLNLDKLAGWKGSEVFVTGVYAFGDQTSVNYLHNFQNISSIAGTNTLRLNEAWWEQRFGQGFDLRLGQLAAQDEFALQDFYATFINNSFGNPQPIGSVNAPFTPAGKPGARLRWAQEAGPWYAQTGVYDGDPTPFINDRNGVAFRTDDPVVWAGELGYRSTHFLSIDHRQGDYKLGFIRNFGDFTGFNGTSNTNGRDFFYGMAEQTVWSRSDASVDVPDAPWAPHPSPFSTPASLGVALTVAGSPDNEAYSNLYLSGQLRYKGLFSARPDDVIAGGFEYAKFSEAASEANEAMGGSYLTGEKVAEVTYRFRVTPYFAIQPDLQYILDPAGVSVARNELVIGVRTSIKF
jgi:porin